MFDIYICLNVEPYRPVIVARSPGAAMSAMVGMLQAKGWEVPKLPDKVIYGRDNKGMPVIVKTETVEWRPQWKVLSANQPGAYLLGE